MNRRSSRPDTASSRAPGGVARSLGALILGAFALGAGCVESSDGLGVTDGGAADGTLGGTARDRVELPVKDGGSIQLHLDASASIPVANLSRPDGGAGSTASEDDVATSRAALNWGGSLEIARGGYRYFTLQASANHNYFVTTTPAFGDLDIYAYRWTGSGWSGYGSSLRGVMHVDRVALRHSTDTYFLVVLYAYTAAGGTVTASWETGAHRLDLDVPFYNQNWLAGIGTAACSSTSTSMVLATHGLIAVDEMASEAYGIFDATASTSDGLLSRQGLADHLRDEWGVSQVRIDTSGWPELYAAIQREIRAGRPLILGSKSMSGAGHYLVVRGFVGDDYASARLIVNDPNGRWLGYDSWSTGASGAGLEYDYRAITSRASDGVFVIVP